MPPFFVHSHNIYIIPYPFDFYGDVLSVIFHIGNPELKSQKMHLNYLPI